MRVGRVKTRPGRPMIACDPNSAIAFTKAIRAPESTAGATSGSGHRPRDLASGRRRGSARLLQRGVDRLQRARRQEVDEREGVEHGHQHQPRHREDVEGERRQAGDVAQEAIDEAGVGAEQVHERDGGEERRGDVGDDGDQVDEAAGRRVGPADRPRQRQPDGDAEHRRPRAEDERVDQRLRVEPAAERLPEVGEREVAALAEAAPHQGRQRQHDEQDERHGRDGQDGVLDSQ